jgi:Ca2+-binding RTX toxin-like protein
VDFGSNRNDFIHHLGDGNWITFGRNGNDTVVGSDGTDIMFGGKGNDTLVGNDGTDIMFGGKGSDTLVGNDGFNLLFGDKGNDTLIGGDHGNFLDGGAGKDTVIGGDGNDILAGGAGKDMLFGGDGHDTFVFSSGGGRDLVMDFQDGDILQIQRNINGLHVHDAADLMCRIHSDRDGNAVIDLGHGDSITLVDVSADDVKADPNSFIKIH